MLPINEEAARAYLKEHKWPSGIQNVCLSQLQKIPYRFMIVDDSGSMAANDGHKLTIKETGKIKYVLLILF